MQDIEEGLISIWNHVNIYMLYCEDLEVKDNNTRPTNDVLKQWGNIQGCVIMQKPWIRYIPQVHQGQRRLQQLDP